jgi:hypothetical protein
MVARMKAVRSTSALGPPRPAVPSAWYAGHGDKASGASFRGQPHSRLARSGLEHSLGKGEVVSSILTGSTTIPKEIKDVGLEHFLFPPGSDANKRRFPH